MPTKTRPLPGSPSRSVSEWLGAMSGSYVRGRECRTGIRYTKNARGFGLFAVSAAAPVRGDQKGGQEEGPKEGAATRQPRKRGARRRIPR
jgi:hypothetical protein